MPLHTLLNCRKKAPGIWPIWKIPLTHPVSIWLFTPCRVWAFLLLWPQSCGLSTGLQSPRFSVQGAMHRCATESRRGWRSVRQRCGSVLNSAGRGDISGQFRTFPGCLAPSKASSGEVSFGGVRLNDAAAHLHCTADRLSRERSRDTHGLSGSQGECWSRMTSSDPARDPSD